MKIKTLFPFLGLLLFFYLINPLLARELNEDGDFQLWFHPGIDKKIDKKSALYFVGEYRFGADASKLYHFYFQGMYSRKLGKHFEIGSGFRQTYTLDPALNIWRARSDPMFDFYVHFEEQKVEFLVRARTQYQITEVGPNHLQQRLLAQVKFPIKIARFTPYVYDEIFVSTSRGFRENRLSAGVYFPITSKLEGNIHYILRRIHIEKWVQHNVLRIHLQYSF